MEFTEKDNGNTVRLKNEEYSISVRLIENATTGYLWEVKNFPADSKLTDSDATEPKGKMAGAASVRIFSFSLGKQAKGKLKLQNCRPWDTNDCIDSFELEFVRE
ncbi:MAG: protease inhibitor I42 family protein [Pricia sp.]|nr:protease inhibitor I42 family protein [Pricia sp.]